MLSSTALAAGEFNSIDELGNWISHYYLNPEPSRICKAIQYFSQSSAYQTNSRAPTVFFFSRVLKENNSLLEECFSEISLSSNEDSKAVFLNALWYIDSQESRSLLKQAQEKWTSKRLQEIIVRLLESPVQDLTTVVIDKSVILDMLWTAFFATGDDWPIRRLISVIHLEKDGVVEEIALGGAADWSLDANSREHKKVCQICKAELPTSSGPTKELLSKIVLACSK